MNPSGFAKKTQSLARRSKSYVAAHCSFWDTGTAGEQLTRIVKQDGSRLWTERCV
jgi:hypothetical protein